MKKRNLLFALALVLLAGCGGTTTNTDQNTEAEAFNFLKLTQERRAIRNYLPQEVEQAKLDYILETARLAPSATNNQPWIFYVVKGDEAKNAVYKSYNAGWLKTAPVLIVACYDRDVAWVRSADNKSFGDVDVAIALEHMVLAATEQGLGTCWVAHFDPQVLISEFQIPANLSPVAIIPVGYPHPEQGEKSGRKPIEEIVRYL